MKSELKRHRGKARKTSRNRPSSSSKKNESSYDLRQQEAFSASSPQAGSSAKVLGMHIPAASQPVSGGGAIPRGGGLPLESPPSSKPRRDGKTTHKKTQAPPDAMPEERRTQARRRTARRRQAAPKKLSVGNVILRAGGIVMVFLVAVVALLFGAITIVCNGPFPTAKELFVVSVNETSAVKFLSRIYFSEEEVKQILAANSVQVPDEITDTTKPFAEAETSVPKEDIEIHEVVGSTFKGKMMIVHDPSRIKLATIGHFGPEVSGKRIEDFVADEGAVAGINAGGFADLNGVGKGGQPLGLVIKDGQIVSGSANTSCNVIGFDYDHRLIVGMMSGQEALDMNMQYAVHFEPTLIVNGTPAEVAGTGGGLNPRTVIGQRADGAVLMLVIDGRQPHSIGATLQDCMQVMLDYEAVNAANLDGGSSSMMVYEGEVINVCASLYGSRMQPTAFLVM